MSDSDISVPGLFMFIRQGNRVRGERIQDLHEVEAKPEVYIPSKFTSNGRPTSQGRPSKITHLQHVTHTPECDLISSGTGSHELKGRPKKAQLYFYDDDRRVRVGTWKLEKDGYRQLGITKCQSCENDKPCEHGSCCTYDANFFTSIGNPLVRFSKLTCYRDSTDPSSCNGSRCYCIESVLPGTYVWFGVAHVENERLDDRATSIYGMWSYVVSLPTLLQRYRERFGEAVFRCGGTLHYQQEICYVVLITTEHDVLHGDETYPRLTAESSGPGHVLDCSRFLDSSGHPINLAKFRCRKQNKEKIKAPIFRPAHEQDHVVFAVHVPDRMELILHDRDLLTSDPIEVEHTYCRRFKYFGSKSIRACDLVEKRYDEEYSGSNSSEENSCSDSSEKYSGSEYLGRKSIQECSRIERKYSTSLSTDKLSDSEEQHEKPSSSASESRSLERNYDEDRSSDGDDDFISEE